MLGNPSSGVYPTTITVTDGVFELSALTIEAGGVLVLRGSNPARLVVRGEAAIAAGGLIDASGGNVGFHHSDAANGQVGGAAGPGGGRGGDGADRADFTGTSLLVVGGLANPGAERTGSAGTGIGNGAVGGGQGGERWPLTYPSSITTSIQGFNGGVAWNVAFHPNGVLNDSCVSLQMGGPGGGGSYARAGTAGTSTPSPSAASVQFPTIGGSTAIAGAGGAAGDLAGLGLEPPSPTSGHDVRILRWQRGHLRGGAGGGGGGNHPYMTLGGGDPPSAGNNCWFFLFGTPATYEEWHDHSGGAGGGAVELLAGRSITLDGLIEARGGQGGSSLPSALPFDFAQYAMAGGGGAGGAVRITAPNVTWSPNDLHIDVRGGVGGTSFWAFPTASPTASRGGDGAQGLVRIENSLSGNTFIGNAASVVAPFSPPSTAHPHLSIGTGGFDALGRERPDAVNGAASCWIQPTGNIARLRIRADTGPLLGQQGWSMNVVVTGPSGQTKRPFRGRAPQFTTSFEAQYGNLVGYDLGVGEVASPIVVRFQGARRAGTLTSPCGLDPQDPQSGLEAGSLTPWVAHPADLNDLLDPTGTPYAPNVVRYVVLFDQTIELSAGDTPGLTLQSEGVVGIDDLLILADEY